MALSKLKLVVPVACSFISLATSAPAQAQDLVSQARQYIGTNPTGRAHLWCATFINMVLEQTGHRGGGNLAMGYVQYGPRVPGPQVGALAIMGRRGGGHIGVVSGIDASGNPIVISGNTWGKGSRRPRVLEAPVARGRVYAYVLP